MDGQTADVTAPSVGTFKVRVVASNYCQLKGLHGLPVLGLGVLPWGEKPLERREVVRRQAPRGSLWLTEPRFFFERFRRIPFRDDS
jgi:hypothetical protein